MSIPSFNILFPYLTLALLIIGLFTIRSLTFLRVGLAIQIMIAFLYGLVTPVGVLLIVLFWGMCEWRWRYPISKGLLEFCVMVLLLIVALAFANHLMPGFDNFKVFNAVSVSPISAPFNMYLNFDKTIVAVILVITSGLLVAPKRAWNMRMLVTTLTTTAFCIAVLLPLAIGVGFIAFDPKFPNIFWLWALNNLFFVCFAEEVIFRGIIQNYLMQIAQKRQWPSFIPILITAVLFAVLLLGHVKSGPAYMGFVMIAGLFYGYVYYKTARLEAAILTHFGVNAAHFLLFTYPVLHTTV